MKILIVVLLVVLALSVKIDSGELEVQVKTTSLSGVDKFKLKYDSQIRTELKLTQSSIIQIDAKIEFTETDFQPELFTFRLIHPKYEKLTEPVMAQYSSDDGNFKAIIDLGDPKIIKPYSDLYQLQLIISDEKLENSIRKKIANGRVNFRHSIDHVSEQFNQYQPQSIIRSDPPSERIDPPQIFTAFVLVIDVIVTLIFLFGLYHLKVNVNLLLEGGKGLVLNVVLIGLVMVNMVFLFKFWLGWRFIETVQNFFWLLIPTVLVANYAFLSLRK